MVKHQESRERFSKSKLRFKNIITKDSSTQLVQKKKQRGKKRNKHGIHVRAGRELAASVLGECIINCLCEETDSFICECLLVRKSLIHVEHLIDTCVCSLQFETAIKGGTVIEAVK